MNKSKKINLEEKIFVAGAFGMVGSSVCRNLKISGYGDSSKGGEIFTTSRKELDLLDSAKVSEWFQSKKPSIVIIAAAKVGGIYANQTYPADFIFENLKIQTNLIEASWKNGVKRLLFLGSSCIYPRFAPQPIKEESLLTGSLESTNEAYAIAKISGIKLCQALRKQYDFDAISLMPTNLYGTGDNYNQKNSHVMPALIRKFCEAVKSSKQEVTCWGTGKVMREFLHVDDLGKAITFALEYWDPILNTEKNDDFLSSTILNVGTGKDIKIEELASIIAKKVGFKGIINWDKSKPDGTPRKLLNVEKLKKLGWEPKISLDEGINKTIQEFREIYL